MLKKLKNVIFYVSIIGGFTGLIYWIATRGSFLENREKLIPHTTEASHWFDFLNSLQINISHPLALLLIQIVTIILAARLLGWFCKKIGQPSVVGEILAGIALGPSLLGMYFPDISNALFPIQSLSNLNFLSQIGLILFMFIVGMEIDLNVLKNKANDAVVISHASIIIPFSLGMGLAYFLYQTYAPAGIGFTAFGLFIGISMSITAFPVLARIVQERGIHKTRLGTVVITCAAADDITGWSVLAMVIAIAKAGTLLSSLYTILMAVAYVFLMIKGVRPFLKRIGDLYSSGSGLSRPVVAIFFLTLILSAWMTEVIGIHALFGAFMAGAIMPSNQRFRSFFTEKIEDVSVVLLLPLFFVFTGLRTQIGLLNDIRLWEVTGLIITLAIAGKFAGSALAAKFVGQNWKDSLTVGALMNTRGLMELVVLNIGYDLGILTPTVFAMMVIMALVTTLMTGPSLNLINRIFKNKSVNETDEISRITTFKILVSFGNPEMGIKLLRLANSFMHNNSNNSSITVMHLMYGNQSARFNLDEYEHNSFAPILDESRKLSQKVTTLFKVSSDIENDITEMGNKGEYDLLLIGIGQSIFEGSLLGRILGFTTRIINPDRLLNQIIGKENLFENSPFDERTHNIITNSKIAVGILIDKGFEKTQTVTIPIFSPADYHLCELVQRLVNFSGAQITFIDINNSISKNTEIKEQIRAFEQIAPRHVRILAEKHIDKNFWIEQDLFIVTVEAWRKILEGKQIWLQSIPSTLIISSK